MSLASRRATNAATVSTYVCLKFLEVSSLGRTNKKMCLVVWMSLSSRRATNADTVSTYACLKFLEVSSLGQTNKKDVPRCVDVPSCKESYERGYGFDLCLFEVS